jgi:hypothetical protein
MGWLQCLSGLLIRRRNRLRDLDLDILSLRFRIALAHIHDRTGHGLGHFNPVVHGRTQASRGRIHDGCHLLQNLPETGKHVAQTKHRSIPPWRKPEH